MKYVICADSSSNLFSDYIKDDEVGFNVIPLTIRVLDKEFVDNDYLNVDEMLDAVNSTKEKCSSSCPSPNDYLKHFNEAEYAICVTISSKLSGSYNSACVARDMSDKKDKILVVDSLLTAGAMRLIVDKAYKLIKEGLSFEEISKKLIEFRNSINLLFVLDKFDNLVKNGRMSKVVAFIANLAAKYKIPEVTKIASGVPLGGAVDTIDPKTLISSLMNRRPLSAGGSGSAGV